MTGLTKYKIYRIDMNGQVTVEIQTAYGWTDLIQTHQYNGNPMFKVEVYGSCAEDEAEAEQQWANQ